MQNVEVNFTPNRSVPGSFEITVTRDVGPFMKYVDCLGHHNSSIEHTPRDLTECELVTAAVEGLNPVDYPNRDGVRFAMCQAINIVLRAHRRENGCTACGTCDTIECELNDEGSCEACVYSELEATHDECEYLQCQLDDAKARERKLNKDWHNMS